jgi:uncharacterized protein YggE
MSSKQSTTGVKVFGSAVLRVEPDLVSLLFAVGRQAKKPREAFRETHLAVQQVRAYLQQEGITDVAGSHVTLSQSFEYSNNSRKPTGYHAQVTLNVLLSDLDRMEDVLAGVVDAGANQIASVDFRTRRLKEYRTEARRRAVVSAREKAENYCRAAAITLGPVLSLEDVHPEALRGTGEQNTSTEVALDDAAGTGAFAPGSILVGAAVLMTFAIAGSGETESLT